jgi:multiple RNA-binding domain-containing protein 1
MGYGFVKFKKAAHANEALKTMQDFSLDGHNLELKFSNKTSAFVNKNSSSNTKNTTQKQKELREKSSKILVRNIPFEAKSKEIQELFQVFGELKYVRLPKKIDGAHRGFGFVDFVTKNDATVCFNLLLFFSIIISKAVFGF